MSAGVGRRNAHKPEGHALANGVDFWTSELLERALSSAPNAGSTGAGSSAAFHPPPAALGLGYSA